MPKMSTKDSSSYINVYREYIHQNYPHIDLESSHLLAEAENTNWENPQSANDLNNVAVIALIEAEITENMSFRSAYLEQAIEFLNQGINNGSYLCAAHLAMVYTIVGENNRATNIAFSTLLNIFQPVYQNAQSPMGLIYLPLKYGSLAGIYNREIDKLLQEPNGYLQALLLLTLALVQSQLFFYNEVGLRFLQLALQIYPNSVLINLQLGLSSLLNQKWEGLLYLQRAKQIAPDCGRVFQSLYLAYKELKQDSISKLWHQNACDYSQKNPDSSEWRWSQLSFDSPFTYIPFDDGVFLSVESSLHSIVTGVLLAQGDWFEREMEFWRNQIQPGMTVIDVGANVGVYTFSAAIRVGDSGKVLAVEPFAGCIKCLEETCRINQFSCVKVLAGAASNHNGAAFLYLHGASELNEVVDKTTQKSENLVEIECFTLDSLIERQKIARVDWLKLDAEGHEMQVLRGSQRLLTEFAPRIIYENIAGSKGSNIPVAAFLQER